MSFTPATETDGPTRPSPAAAAATAEPDDVEYPERQWIAQSVAHGEAVMQAAMALRNHFAERQDVLVAMELAVYYQRGDATVWKKPDVQVVLGARSAGGRHLRSRVLGLDLRSGRRVGGTVLVFRDPVTGEEFDGALEAAEQRRREAEDRARAEAKGRREAENRAKASEERVRALEKQFGNLASHGPRPEREP